MTVIRDKMSVSIPCRIEREAIGLTLESDPNILITPRIRLAVVIVQFQHVLGEERERDGEGSRRAKMGQWSFPSLYYGEFLGTLVSHSDIIVVVREIEFPPYLRPSA